jgi:2-keto-4-pentenoate hydratase/2-oxohepta-3-ene-1,7-dioic acid hydratase in catechol pathway
VRIANIHGRASLLVDDGAIDLATASNGRFGPDLHALYDDWTAARDFASSLDVTRANPEPFEDKHLGPPAPAPRQVFAIGVNYRAHAEESGMDLPKMPATFTKYPTCITGPFADVALPSAVVDWEVELVVVIGTRAEHAAEDNAWSHVAGLTIGQDLSERVVQFAAGAQFALGKSYPGFGPIGPWLVTPDALDNPDDLALGCAVDGETVQDARTSDMVFSVPQLIAQLSAIVPLLPGDIIFTGTPSGIGATRQPARFLQPGQQLETWIEGIGRMRNRLVGAGT